MSDVRSDIAHVRWPIADFQATIDDVRLDIACVKCLIADWRVQKTEAHNGHWLVRISAWILQTPWTPLLLW